MEQVGAFIDARLPRWHTPGVVVGLTDRDGSLAPSRVAGQTLPRDAP